MRRWRARIPAMIISISVMIIGVGAGYILYSVVHALIH